LRVLVLTPPASALERRYALRAVKQRLHQASFREAVITAYNGRCALSGLQESLLLDAAHIILDKDEKFGQPVVRGLIDVVFLQTKDECLSYSPECERRTRCGSRV